MIQKWIYLCQNATIGRPCYFQVFAKMHYENNLVKAIYSNYRKLGHLQYVGVTCLIMILQMSASTVFISG